jgi:molecular chaperone Hsp33
LPADSTLSDSVRRFAVEHQAVRGEFVRLGPAWLALREHADYPPAVRTLLGEAVAASVLLASTLKFEGELTLQLQGDGAVRLLVAQCTHDFKVRAVARFDAARVPMNETVMDFAALAGEGTIAVTVEADKRSARYQGVVPIDGVSLAASLEHYFANSEQLPTRLALAADAAGAAGVLVQRMPQAGGAQSGGASADAAAAESARETLAWDTYAAASAAVDSLAADELLARASEELMQRTFAGLDLRLFAAQAIEFRCRCDRERVTAVLRSLGSAEVDSIIREQGAVTVTCEFCHKPWRFDAVDTAELFGEAASHAPGSPALN